MEEIKIALLERKYEELLKALGIEMIEGCGLEGDWDSMTETEKREALLAAVNEAEERMEEVRKSVKKRKNLDQARHVKKGRAGDQECGRVRPASVGVPVHSRYLDCVRRPGIEEKRAGKNQPGGENKIYIPRR